MNRINPALQYVEKIEEISDIKKVAQMLSSGEWIDVYKRQFVSCFINSMLSLNVFSASFRFLISAV